MTDPTDSDTRESIASLPAFLRPFPFDYVTRKERRAELRTLLNAPPEPLPEWLTSHREHYNPDDLDNPEVPIKYKRTVIHDDLELINFEAAFETLLDHIAEGKTFTGFVNADPRGLDPGRFKRWIRKDKERLARYEEANLIGTEMLEDMNMMIAEGTHTVEDIERSKLRIATNRDKMKAWNKPRYGDSKQLEITSNSTIDIRALIEQRDNQLLDLTRTYEGELGTITSPVLVEDKTETSEE